MKLFSVYSEQYEAGHKIFLTKSSAINAAIESNADNVELIDIGPVNRETIMNIINQNGYVLQSTVIWSNKKDKQK